MEVFWEREEKINQRRQRQHKQQQKRKTSTTTHHTIMRITNIIDKWAGMEKNYAHKWLSILHSGSRVRKKRKRENHMKRDAMPCVCTNRCYKCFVYVCVCQCLYRKCGNLMTNLNQTLVQYIINTCTHTPPPKKTTGTRGQRTEDRRK